MEAERYRIVEAHREIVHSNGSSSSMIFDIELKLG